jgi:hypothetical protein
MSTTTTEAISTPKSKTEWISTKLPKSQKITINFSEIYFVIVHTINGGRFYSEAVQGSEAAYELFSSYCDIAEYFGGICELFYVNEDGYDIIDHQIF